MRFNLSRHAQREMKRRSIPSVLLQSVLQTPQQIVPQTGNKRVYQSQLDFGGGKVFLLRRRGRFLRSRYGSNCISDKQDSQILEEQPVKVTYDPDVDVLSLRI